MSTFRPTTAGDWPQVLNHVEQALARAVAKIQQREQALANAVLQEPPPPDYQRFQDHLDGLNSYPERAEKRLAELDVDLRESEDVLRQWLARAEAFRQQMKQ
jgi:hypothetical protein